MLSNSTGLDRHEHTTRPSRDVQMFICSPHLLVEKVSKQKAECMNWWVVDRRGSNPILVCLIPAISGHAPCEQIQNHRQDSSLQFPSNHKCGNTKWRT
jgi:hypothetical protein